MPPMSPRTQAMAAPNPTGDQAKTLFDQGLSQMAYSVLVNKLPNIASDVVTFKVLDSDPEEGSGVGAFVILRRGQTVYVPVVMAENQVKPLDILFFKDLNVFLPLTKEWLEELDKMSLGEMGKGVKPPSTLETDVDIRNTVVPPTTGRYSYAADTSEKTAAAIKQAVWHYGEKPLIDALAHQQEKVADYGAKMSPTGALYIADKSTTPGEFKDIFGPKAPLAFSGVSLKGYFAKDDRKVVKRALKIQPHLDLVEPKDPGAYRLWNRDGKPVLALVVHNPVNLFRGDSSRRIPAQNTRFTKANDGPANPLERHGKKYRSPGITGKTDESYVDRYLAITEDGKLLETNELLGEQVAMSQLEGSAVYKKTVGEATAAGPRVGQRGVFVQKHGSSFVATTPVKIDAITSLGDGVKRIEVTSGWEKRTLVIDANSPLSRLTVPNTGSISYLPTDFVFIPVSGDLVEGDLLTNPKDVLKWATAGVLENGAEKIAVYKKPGRGFVVGREELDFVPALRKLATEAEIGIEDAEYALKQADEQGRYEFWTLSEKSFQKIAEGDAPPKKDKKPSGDGATAGGSDGQDPAQAAMDQVGGAPMAPAMPSPIDMAVAEQMQNLMQQSQSITQMQQLLQTVQQRANMIATGGGAMGAPAAAAAAMGGPMPGGSAPVPGMGGDPSQMAMAQGGGPQAAGLGQPSMAPSMGGQPMQGSPQMGGGDPSQMQQDPNQQPPQAMMSADDGSVESVMSQVNPQFMEQAGQLQDAGTFDAAALASMAQAPALKDLVGAYLPNLEKSLDNIGRVLLTLWMDESRIKADIGNETFIALEDNLRTVFRGMGDLILKVNQNTMILRDPNEHQFTE